MSPVRVFVTGTDTGVGKTQVSTALLSLLADEGLNPAPFKPYESGVPASGVPEDAAALIQAARSTDPLDLVCPHRFSEPLAPGVAARRLGVEPSFERTLEAFATFEGRSVVAEGAGGLIVPIDSRRDVRDLIVALGLPVVLVARASLGTLNHTALSLEALERAGVKVKAVVLSRTADVDDPSERDNAQIIAERHCVRVVGPVPFRTDADARREAFRTALAPLVSEWITATAS